MVHIGEGKDFTPVIEKTLELGSLEKAEPLLNSEHTHTKRKVGKFLMEICQLFLHYSRKIDAGKLILIFHRKAIIHIVKCRHLMCRVRLIVDRKVLLRHFLRV